MSDPLPDPALVVLVGASGSGKSTWAAERYRSTEIVSSDALRAVTGTGPADLAASVDAFAVLELVVAARLRRRLTTVVDTVGQDPVRRRSWRELAAAAGLPAVMVIMDTDASVCRERNARRDHRVPAEVLRRQLRRVPEVIAETADEGWDRIEVVRDAAPGEAPHPVTHPVTGPTVDQPTDAPLRLVLQLSRFPATDDLAEWLRSMAVTAHQVGFTGIALMDHLIQIPQVGRAWDPIPEPWVTLGLVAGLDLGLELGTLVTPVTFREPGIVAKAAATLSALTGGRSFCGIGAGWWAREHAAYGLDFPSATERLDRLERCVHTLRALWAPGTKAYDGPGPTLPETTCYPRPAGPIPIIVGGSGERRTLQIAARWADGCNLPSDPTVLAHKISVLRRHCAEAERDPAEVAVTVLDLPVLGTDREDVAVRVERLRGRSSPQAYRRGHPAGTATVQLDRYRSLHASGVATVFLAPADLTGPAGLEGWAPVVAGLRS